MWAEQRAMIIGGMIGFLYQLCSGERGKGWRAIESTTSWKANKTMKLPET